MKIAIFENEYESVRGAFDTANLLGFNNELVYEVYPSSQKADFETISNYAAIFIDIDLSQKSDLDGFGVIQKLNEISHDLNSKIIILTGNNKIKESMNERGVADPAIQIIIKPTDYLEVESVIRRVIGKS